MTLTQKIKIPLLLITTLAAFSGKASVNFLTGAFENEWQDQLGGSETSPQVVNRGYNSREGWSFDLSKVGNKKLKLDPTGRPLQIGKWKYQYQDQLLIKVSGPNFEELYLYDEYENLTSIESAKSKTKISYDSQKDRVLSVKDSCLLQVSYEESLKDRRYELITQLQTKCPLQNLNTRQYRFQFKPSPEGWVLEQVWTK